MSFQTFEKSPPVHFLACQTCPSCRETVFAAEGAEVTDDAITYRWTCDLCGHAFTTRAKLTAIADEVRCAD
jgi:ribosomal protein S27AE